MNVARFRIASSLSLIVAFAGLAGSAPAIANYRDASAGAVCHPANGALAAKFTYNLHYLTNAGTTDAYVICHLPMDDASLVPNSLSYLRIDVLTAGAGSTVTCVAQTGAFYAGSVHIYKSSSLTHTSSVVSESFALGWDVADIQRANVYEVLVINCKLAPGAKLGLLQYEET
jgi:hypothetical protein